MSTVSTSARSFNRDSIPAELRSLRQWVGWRLVHVPDRKKPTKKPLNPRTGELASTTDPATWGTFDDALVCPGSDGVGFVFTANDPYVGIDLDECRDTKTGALDQIASDIIARLASYTEVSPSGTGPHVIVRGMLPGTGRRRGSIEMYAEGRYFTMTGARLEDAPADIVERETELHALHDSIFEERAVLDSRPQPIHTRFTDNELVRRAQSASSGAKFTALWPATSPRTTRRARPIWPCADCCACLLDRP